MVLPQLAMCALLLSGVVRQVTSGVQGLRQGEWIAVAFTLLIVGTHSVLINGVLEGWRIAKKRAADPVLRAPVAEIIEWPSGSLEIPAISNDAEGHHRDPFRLAP
jgi:hypothetical protein